MMQDHDNAWHDMLPQRTLPTPDRARMRSILTGMRGVALLLLGTAFVAAGLSTAAAPARSVGVSLRFEALSSVRRAARYLLDAQLPDGSWSRHPLPTAYALLALAASPVGSEPDGRAAIQRGAAWLAGLAQPSGALANELSRQYPVYATAMAMRALVQAGAASEHAAIIRQAQQYLEGAQRRAGPDEAAEHGGFGIAPDATPDVSTTAVVIEALLSLDGATGPEAALEAPPTWLTAALEFLGRCQVTEARPDADERDKRMPGWFRERPDQATRAEAAGVPRSGWLGVGARTWTVLHSLFCARPEVGGPRLSAAVDWGLAHWTATDGPEVDERGSPAYLLAATSALARLEVLAPEMIGDRLPRWRVDTLNGLFARQAGDGAWRPTTAAGWWESHPELATAYALLTIEQVLRE